MPAVKRPQKPQAKRPAPRGRQPSAPAPAPGRRSGRGLPWRTLSAAVAVLAVGGGLIVASAGGRGAAVAATIGAGVGKSFGELGFKVARVEVRGASPFAKQLILDAIGAREGAPSLGVDLADLRAQIESVGYVRSATVARMLPDTLVITVQERNRQAIWQEGGRLQVIDDHGQLIPEADPALFPGLPMVVGVGAETAAHEVIPLVQARPRLFKRLEALVRVDDRRWDLRLKDGSLIQLPATGEDGALIQLDQLDGRSRLLELGFERIDLRDAEMVAVRPRGQPAPFPAAYLPKPVEPAPATTVASAAPAPAPEPVKPESASVSATPAKVAQ